MTTSLADTIWTELADVQFELTSVDAGGVATRSLQAGAGEPVVFLHGTSGHLEAFMRNVAAHAAYRVHAIDMLGHGYTGKPGCPYEIPRYRDHLLAYLDAAGIDKAHIVGESLGGWVGARTAIDEPSRIATLQLLCAGGTVANPDVMERIRTSTRKAVTTDDPDLTRTRLRLLMADDADATEELVAIRHAIYHQPDFVANIENLLVPTGHGDAAAQHPPAGGPRQDRRADADRVGSQQSLRRGPRGECHARAHPGLRADHLRQLRTLAAARAGGQVQRAQPRLPRPQPDRLMGTMQAVRVHDWAVPPAVDEVPIPQPAAGESVVRVEAAAVGHLDRTVAGGNFGMKPKLPYIGGVEGCGRIISSDQIREGTRVMCRGGGLGLLRDGTWAEYVAVPTQNLVVVPEGMPPSVGATYFVPVTTAAAALRSIGRLGAWGAPDVDKSADEIVLVAGAAGAVGSMVAQLALRDGARVLGLVLDQEQAERLPAGVEALLADDTDRLDQLAKERPASLLVDTLGGEELYDRLGWVRAGGRAVSIGYVAGEAATLDLPNWLLLDVALLPVNMIRRNREARAFAEELAPLLVTGELVVDVEEFPFHEASRALELLGKGKLRGRAVLVPAHA